MLMLSTQAIVIQRGTTISTYHMWNWWRNEETRNRADMLFTFSYMVYLSGYTVIWSQSPKVILKIKRCVSLFAPYKKSIDSMTAALMWAREREREMPQVWKVLWSKFKRIPWKVKWSRSRLSSPNEFYFRRRTSYQIFPTKGSSMRIIRFHVLISSKIFIEKFLHACNTVLRFRQCDKGSLLAHYYIIKKRKHRKTCYLDICRFLNPLIRF